MAEFRTGVPTTRSAGGIVTYYDALGNEISEAKFNGLQTLIALSGRDVPDVNVVANEDVGTATLADPTVRKADVDFIATLAESKVPLSKAEQNAVIEYNIAVETPGTPEFKAAEGQATIAANIAADATAAKAAEAAFQQSLIDGRDAQDNANRENDWRVRLHLAPGANYLYNDPDDAGILAPLKETNGLIFPYTPEIQVQYTAEYENYDLVHSNYKGYFYRGSKVENIIVTATFTANDIAEANYMLAAMHFLRSATKMFYGKDEQRGMPPPMVFLTGLGEYQFHNHPCAITSIHYNLPNDVDYIPCGKPAGVAIPPLPVRPNTSMPEARLKSAGIGANGKPLKAGSEKNAATNGDTSPYTKATYVPTKIDINFTMIPIQTRDQVSKEFSLKNYASGDLLRKGFW